jgi:uncharacterized protein (DUF1330 family)
MLEEPKHGVFDPTGVPEPRQRDNLRCVRSRRYSLIAKHGGQLLLRLRPTPGSVIAADIEVPYELHVVRFNSHDDLKTFSEDPDRQRILHLKTEAVRSSILVTGTAP